MGLLSALGPPPSRTLDPSLLFTSSPQLLHSPAFSLPFSLTNVRRRAADHFFLVDPFPCGLGPHVFEASPRPFGNKISFRPSSFELFFAAVHSCPFPSGWSTSFHLALFLSVLFVVSKFFSHRGLPSPFSPTPSFLLGARKPNHNAPLAFVPTSFFSPQRGLFIRFGLILDPFTAILPAFLPDSLDVGQLFSFPL